MQTDTTTLDLERTIPAADAPQGIGRAWWLAGLYLLTVAAYTFLNHRHGVGLHYFVPLADAFLHGRLDVLEHPPWLNELVPFNGKYYVVYPPMPAVVLMPFVLLWGAGMNQGVVSILLGALNVVLVADVMHRMGLRRAHWLTFALLFGFGTIHWFSAQLGTAWHFAHVCATAFMLLAIRQALVGTHLWLMGLFFGMAVLSRLPTVMAAPFFMAFLLFRSRAEAAFLPFGHPSAPRVPFWKERPDWRRLLGPTGLFAVGAAIPLTAFLLYNHARFGSPFQAGYALIPGVLEEYQYRHGLFSVHSIGRNLNAMLFKAPNFVETFPYFQPPTLGGLSLLLTTPAFLWAIKARGWDWFTVGTWLAVLCVSLPLLLHGDVGGDQFGYRYAMDFYPFLLLLTARGMGDRLSFEAKLAIGLAFVVNAWGMWATYVHWRG